MSTDVTKVVTMASWITRGLLDPWIDSITIIALRRRNGLRRRAARLAEAGSMANTEDVNQIAQQATQGSASVIVELADKKTELTKLTDPELNRLSWNVGLLTSAIEIELSRRSGQTDLG